MRRPTGLPPYLASLYEMPLLTREQEQHVFRKYNFLKYRAGKLREELDPAQPRAALMDEIESLYQQAIETKNEIARANLRLVVSIAKRHVTPDQNFFELVSDGNVSLLRAIEKFDFARGNKFSTYASWAIMKNFARTIPGEFKHRDRYPHQPGRAVCGDARVSGRPAVRGGCAAAARSAGGEDSAAAGRARAEDHHGPLRTWSGATSRRRSKRSARRWA